jgi:hypothetical protein
LPRDHTVKKKYNDSDNLQWSIAEMNKLIDGTHMLCGEFNVHNETDLNILLKIEHIYETTLIAIIFKTEDPYIKLKAGDLVGIK